MSRVIRRSLWSRLRAWGHVPALVLAVIAGLYLHQAIWDAELAEEQASLERYDVASRQGEQVVLPRPVETLEHLIRHSTERVVVDPALAGQVPEEELTQVREALSQAPVSAYLGFVPEAFDIDGGYIYQDLAEEWSLHLGEPGVYVVLYSDGRTEAAGVGYSPPAVYDEGQGRPGPALLRLAQELVDTPEIHLDEPEPPTLDEQRAEAVALDGVGGGLWAGLGLVGLLVILPIWFCFYLLMGRRQAKRISQ